MSLESLKKSRAAQLGTVTRELNKYADKGDQDPATFNLTKLKEAIRRVELKHEELDRLQTSIFEHTNEINEEEEQKSIETYETQIDTALDTIQHLTKCAWASTTLIEIWTYFKGHMQNSLTMITLLSFSN